MQVAFNPNLRRVVSSLTREPITVDWSRPVGMHEGAPLLVEYDLGAISRQPGVEPFVNNTESGLWRYSPLLPVRYPGEGYADDVGQTPTVCQPRLGTPFGVELHLKLEGGNPSGSFKDRGLAVGVALGVAAGAERFCLPTQGNAGVSAALFSARAGIEPACVYMPESHRKSGYHRTARSFGAQVEFRGSNIAETGRLMRQELAAELSSGAMVDISTFFEPGRLEGKKTMGFEIAEVFGRDALPDYIVYPTGGGTGLVGIWKAFKELEGLGLLDGGRLPRMIAVQSEQCAPVVRAFEQGLEQVEPVTSQGTVADGLDVPSAIMGHVILATLRESRGMAVAVSEADIVTAHRTLSAAGVSSSFEGAATYAALGLLCETGEIPRGSRVLLLITASQLVGLSSVGVRLAAAIPPSRRY